MSEDYQAVQSGDINDPFSDPARQPSHGITQPGVEGSDPAQNGDHNNIGHEARAGSAPKAAKRHFGTALAPEISHQTITSLPSQWIEGRVRRRAARAGDTELDLADEDDAVADADDTTPIN